MAVILKTAEFYNAVKDNLDNEIVPRAIKQVGVGKSLPAELINYQKDISKKTKEITDLANYYIGGEAPPNPDAYGVFIQTNPDNGYPINIEVRQVTSLGGKLDGYSKTENLKYGGLPIYLNTFQKDVELKNDKGETIKGQTGETLQGTKEVANLLGNVYEKTKVSQKDEAGKDVNSEDVLRGSPPPTKMGGLAKMWAAGLPGGEVTRKSIEQQEKTAEQQWQNQEVDFSQLDSFGALSVGVPKNSVLKDPRNNYYYLDNSGKVSKATSKEALQNFVVKNGGKAEDVANKAFLVDSDFVKANPWVEQMPDGTTKDRIIDDNYTGGLTNISPVQSSLVQFSPAQSSPVGFSGNFKSTMPTSTPVSSSLKKEQPPKEYVGGQYDFKSIMEKGKNLLKSFVPKI